MQNSYERLLLALVKIDLVWPIANLLMFCRIDCKSVALMSTKPAYSSCWRNANNNRGTSWCPNCSKGKFWILSVCLTSLKLYIRACKRFRIKCTSIKCISNKYSKIKLPINNEGYSRQVVLSLTQITIITQRMILVGMISGMSTMLMKRNIKICRNIIFFLNDSSLVLFTIIRLDKHLRFYYIHSPIFWFYILGWAYI